MKSETGSRLERAKALNRSSFLFDGMMPWGNLDHIDCIRDAIDGGFNAAHVTVAHFPHEPSMAIDRIVSYQAIVDANSSFVAMVTSGSELAECRNSNRLGVVFGFQDTAPIGYQLDLVSRYASMGVKIIQLTYNDQNPAGSGCCESWQGPLSRFGRNLLKELEANRIAVDLSHCGDETTNDALRLATRPVLFTHSGARSICNAYGRNKTDDQLRALADTGGLVGIPFAPFFIKRDPETHEVLQSSVEDVIRHIEYVAELIGMDRVGIGTDLCATWVERSVIPPESSLRWWRKTCPHVFGVGPTDRYDPYPEGLRRHSDIANLTSAMLSKGWTEAQVAGVLGENYRRVLTAIWKE